MNSYRRILYNIGGGICRITLNRPEKRNALDALLIDELKQAFDEADGDANARVVLLDGAGKDFCSGADLANIQRMAEAGVMESLADAQSLADLFLKMRRHPHPIIAAVRGRAFAGGCGLAMAADLVLAANSAQFAFTEVNLGFVPAMVMALLRRSVPEKRAFEMLAMGEIFGAPAALAAGMLNRVFDDKEFESQAMAYAAKLAEKPGSAVSLTKRLLYQIDGMPFETALESGVQVNALARMTPECRAGVARFLKR